MSADTIRKYWGTKIFQYIEPKPLDDIRKMLESNPFLEHKGLDLKGKKVTIKSKVSITSDSDETSFLSATIKHKKRQSENNSSDFFWIYLTFEIIISRDPSVLIIHGSVSKMNVITESLDVKINPEDDSEETSFKSYGYDRPIQKHIVKKITNSIEKTGNNLLYDPHFKKLDINDDDRGGECFSNRNGLSAKEDVKFCYLFELCSYWEPELHIRNCWGIVSESENKPYNMNIKADFSFNFTSGVKKNQLDNFWINGILPIIQEDNYELEEKECEEKSKKYSRFLKSFE
jgi:hypothetical protein